MDPTRPVLIRGGFRPEPQLWRLYRHMDLQRCLRDDSVYRIRSQIDGTDAFCGGVKMRMIERQQL